MCSCYRSVADFLGPGTKGYTAFLRNPGGLNAKMERGIDQVIESLKKHKVVTPPMFHEALHQYLTREYRIQRQFRGIFDYRKTRGYTVIRIENLDQQHWNVLETLLDRRKQRHPLKSLICHCECPADQWTLAYNIASMLPVVGGILTAAIGSRIILRCLSRAGMPDGRMGRVKWLLITAIIIEILSILVATSAIAPFVNQILKPFERVARIVEIHFLMVIYFRCHPGEASLIAAELKMKDVQDFEDRMEGRYGDSIGGGKRKGGKRKRKRRRANGSAV